MTLLQRFLLGASLALALSHPFFTRADDTKPGDLKPDTPVNMSEEKKDNSLREQDIYIPYDKLRSVFEKHGRGVYLPYEKFDELWKAAQDKTRPAAAPRPPVGAVITEIENEATVGKDVVQVTARLKIDLLSEGWHEVPFAAGRRGDRPGDNQERAGPHPGRRERRPSPPYRAQGQATGADRTGAGIRPCDNPLARARIAFPSKPRKPP